MNQRLSELVPEFVTLMSEKMEFGKLYVSEQYKTAIHLCPCGCGEHVVTPFHPLHGWTYFRDEMDKVTLNPSIGNFQIPCKTHYFIRENRIDWC